MESVMRGIENSVELAKKKDALTWFKQLVQPDQCVGDVYSINYNTALVLVHDFLRQKVGGIPSTCFLLATRQSKLDTPIDFMQEDSSLILLRVIDSAQLPSGQEMERLRVESAQRVSGKPDEQWDDSAVMDAYTNNYLSYAALQCRVLGTFYLVPDTGGAQERSLALAFGCDLSNFYPNRGLKVYKPKGGALEAIVNYRPPERVELSDWSAVRLGSVRYASTDRQFQNVGDVPVMVNPADLLGQKSALFGMTRMGKSNTTKVLAKAVFDLRFASTKPARIGQLVFDPDGEYANENVQDADTESMNPNALRNVWHGRSGSEDEDRKDVVIYSLRDAEGDLQRRLMKYNFYTDLAAGKQLMDSHLEADPAKYVQNFRQVQFGEAPIDPGDKTRYDRNIFAYRALLNLAGFECPSSVRPVAKGLFGKSLLDAMSAFEDSDPELQSEIRMAGTTLGKADISWSQAASALRGLHRFLATPKYKSFNNDYMNNHDGKAWADQDLRNTLEMLGQRNGSASVAQVRRFHSSYVNSNFANDVVNDLVGGRLVIVDQSFGDPQLSRVTAEQVMRAVYTHNRDEFCSGQMPTDMLVYVEEAHTLLPSGSSEDLTGIWVKVAKEGGKYRIGLVYATQEPSSIQKNILKNTANWFIGHLNNTDETREISKFYDFADFEQSILRAQNKGFLRVKTLSNLFSVPTQVVRFQIDQVEISPVKATKQATGSSDSVTPSDGVPVAQISRSGSD